ncbi:HAMP domain-containing sensor histidine kinase [Clostridiaceae bacterium M8S5]|nr:HAMP domain-containing sensor histidine kinase [Clostridiaceae bacterium M8S5]
MKKFRQWKTNIRLTNTFLIVFILITVFVIVINIIFTGLGVVSYNKITNTDPETLTRKFKEYISFNKTISIKDRGKTFLTDNNAWLQILDDNLTEVYSTYKPSSIPASYTTFKLLNNFKYDINKSYTIFVNNINVDNHEYIYVIGYPLEEIAKHTVVFKPSMLRNAIQKLGLLVTLDLILIVLVLYILLSRKFTTPINKIIGGIDNLAKGNYNINLENKGIFKHVFYNLNQLGETLNKSLASRKEVENIRNEWISSISHDLKTPLSSIRGFAELLKNPDYSFSKDELIEYSNIIWSKSMHIENLINDLNLTNKLKNKLIPLKLARIDVNDLLEDIVLQISGNPLYSNRNIDLQKSSSKINVNIDKSLMERAINNIIINALKHNDDNVNVNISINKTSTANIIIKDNGKGIPQDDLKHVFNKYYRGTNTSSDIEGSGLGMAIAKSIVTSHGGIISIDSSIGVGTEVVISIRL